MYSILNEPVESDRITPWTEILPPRFRVFGYSWVGDFFLCSEDRTEFGVLLAHSATFEPIPTTDIRMFEVQFLAEPAIRSSVLRSDDVDFLLRTIGEPTDNEVFFPVPYPWIGGSGDLDTYKKGNVWVYASLSAQSHDLNAA